MLYCKICKKEIPELTSKQAALQFHAHRHASELFAETFKQYELAADSVMRANEFMQGECFGYGEDELW